MQKNELNKANMNNAFYFLKNAFHASSHPSTAVIQRLYGLYTQSLATIEVVPEHTSWSPVGASGDTVRDDAFILLDPLLISILLTHIVKTNSLLHNRKQLPRTKMTLRDGAVYALQTKPGHSRLSTFGWKPDWGPTPSKWVRLEWIILLRTSHQWGHLTFGGI